LRAPREHICAALLLSGGVLPKFVQELLGHSSIAMTLDRYSHWMPSVGRATAEAIDAALGQKPGRVDDPPVLFLCQLARYAGREKVVIGRVPRPVNQWGVEKDRKDPPPAGAREHPSTH
jgi:hypothetical protein